MIRTNTRNLIYLIFSFSVTFLVFNYLFKNIELAWIFDLIENVDRTALLIFVSLSIAGSLFRLWRYVVLLQVAGYQSPKIALFLIVLVRNLFSDLLPARIGTLIYVYLVNTRLGLPLGTALASFSLSFLFDLLALVPLVIPVIMLTQETKFDSSGLLIIITVLFAICTVLIYALAPILRLFSRAISSRVVHSQKVSEYVNRFAEDIDTMKRANVFGSVLVLSLMVRICKYASYYYFLLGILLPLGFSVAQISISSSVLDMLAAEAAASMPISGIAGFGAYEGAWALTFQLLGFAPDIANMTAVAHHLFTQIYGYSLGAIALLLLTLPIFKRNKMQVLITTPAFDSINSYLRISASILILFCLVTFTSSFISPHQDDAHMSSAFRKSQAPPNESELAQRQSLSQKFSAQIIFDSNRSGTFGIYVMDSTGQNVKSLVDTQPWHEQFPDPSPDGRYIAYARSRTLSRYAPSEIWLLDRADSSQSKIANNGTFPRFSSDGKGILFERGRKKVMLYALESGQETQLFPANDSKFAKHSVVKPVPAPNQRKLAFTSDYPKNWSAWVVDLSSGKEILIGPGCEPSWLQGSETLVWINKEGMQAGSGIMTYSLGEKSSRLLLDDGPPYGHEYFPTVTPDGRFLLYSAAPEKEHSHESANYQIYVRDLINDETVRISFDNYTNRWPKRLENWRG